MCVLCCRRWLCFFSFVLHFFTEFTFSDETNARYRILGVGKMVVAFFIVVFPRLIAIWEILITIQNALSFVQTSNVKWRSVAVSRSLAFFKGLKCLFIVHSVLGGGDGGMSIVMISTERENGNDTYIVHTTIDIEIAIAKILQSCNSM